MPKSLRWKFTLIIGVILACLYGMFGIPKSLDELKANLAKNIHLGLDLKGGSHLVLQVQAQDAFKAEAAAAAERMKDALTKARITFASAEITDPQTIADADKVRIIIRGVANDRVSDFRSTINDRFGDVWQIASVNGNEYQLSMKSTAALNLRRDTVQRTMQTIENRINGLGLAESTVQTRGTSDLDGQVLVQLPGVDDPTRIKALLQTAALLEISEVKGGPFPNAEAALQQNGGVLPLNTKLVREFRGGVEVFYLLNRTPVVTGRDVRNARPSQNQAGVNQTDFTLSQDAASRFAAFTGANIGKQLAVVLDNKIQTVANIKGQISDSGVIEGQASQQESADLALVLKAGSLPASLVYLEERTVLASLGADSIRDGIIAAIVGLVAVVAAMLIYYRRSGINATLALFLNGLILLAALAYFGATLTLPGIAGIILTIGMAVDSNVLIFERIREELHNGKTVVQSIDVGFDKAFATIIDTHLATMISCAFLFFFGTANVKGFAVTLVIGLVANVFTAVFVSRFIFDWEMSRETNPKTLSI